MWMLNIFDIGIIVSIIYIIIVIVFCCWIKNYFGDFFTRKIIHIFMAGWWSIRIYNLDDYKLWAGPFVFTIITYIYTNKTKIKTGMEHFCFSLTILTAITTYNKQTVIPATIALIVMGISDPIAAIVGKKYQLNRNQEKNYCLVGSIAFAFSAIVSLEAYFFFCEIYDIFIPIVIAIITAYIEARIFPKYDNITVPFVAYILSSFLM